MPLFREIRHKRCRSLGAKRLFYRRPNVADNTAIKTLYLFHNTIIPDEKQNSSCPGHNIPYYAVLSGCDPRQASDAWDYGEQLCDSGYFCDRHVLLARAAEQNEALVHAEAAVQEAARIVGISFRVHTRSGGSGNSF